jgi:hypothetical protein
MSIPWRSRLRELSWLGDVRDRWHRVLILAALTGVTTGLFVAGFEWITAQVLLDHAERLPHAVLAVTRQ